MIKMPRKPDLSIIGKIFNNLKVDSLTDQRNNYGRLLYSCTCLICGANRMATRENIKRGEIKDCGRHKYKDRTGERYGRLTVLKIVEGQTIHNKWYCVCDCGTKCVVNIYDLLSGRTTSCGCQQKESVKKLYVDDTAPHKLRSDKLRSTNTSGVTGVWWDKNRSVWVAEIMFKKKKYNLGRYTKKTDAIKARKNAEERIWGDFLTWYNSKHGKNK